MIRIGLFTTVLIIGFVVFYEGKASSSTSASSSVSLPDTSLDYAQIKPILEKRCMICHGCYDAPCQLKLTSYTGVSRGASKKKVYDGERILNMQPTRLFIDANSIADWRDKGFYSAIGADNPENSVLYRILQLKETHPQPKSGRLPNSAELALNREQVCPTEDEFDEFAKDHPYWGMPYGLPNLPKEEYRTLLQWAKSGAPGEKDQLKNADLSPLAQSYEKFLNQPSKKQQLMARYVYEHLFLGHLNFKDDPDHFFMLVRSKTAPGVPIDLIPSVRPYDDPKVDRVYYRLRPVTWTLVDKDHLLYEVNENTVKNYQAWFLSEDVEVSQLPGYDPKQATNPFKTFWQLPASGRYRFMLDQAQFIIGGFIKGPVCRGQTALNVIEERFWVMFFDPDKDVISRDSQFLYHQADNLSLPAEEGSETFRMLAAFTKYQSKQEAYIQAKKAHILKHRQEMGKGFDLIWHGNGNNPNALLTIFRNQDSATVLKGLWGKMPKTAWVIDYPLFERIQYLLVSGYDVFGNIGHQLNTRLYMDFLRMEGENNYLSFLPEQKRQFLREYWYRNTPEEMFREHLSATQTQIEYALKEPIKDLQSHFWGDTETPKQPEVDSKPARPALHRRTDTREVPKTLIQNSELTDQQVADQAMSDFFARFFHNLQGKSILNTDRLNRPVHRTSDTTLNAMRQLANQRGKLVSKWPNVSFLKVTYLDKPPRYFTLILDKGFYNVTSLLLSKQNRVTKEDGVTILEGTKGSYPNQFFSISESQLDDFLAMAGSVQNQEGLSRWVSTFGLRRTDDRFWPYLDELHDYAKATEGKSFGLFDLNRYENN